MQERPYQVKAKAEHGAAHQPDKQPDAGRLINVPHQLYGLQDNDQYTDQIDLDVQNMIHTAPPPC